MPAKKVPFIKDVSFAFLGNLKIFVLGIRAQRGGLRVVLLLYLF